MTTLKTIEEEFDKEFRYCESPHFTLESEVIKSFYRQKIAELVKECVSKSGCSGDTYDKEIHCGCREIIIENFKQAGIELTEE